MRWMVIVLLSGVMGTAAAASDVLSGGAGEWRALALVLNAGCVWAGLAMVCGWLARGRVQAGLAGVVGLAVAVVGYYGYAVLLGDRADLTVRAVAGSLRFWLLAAVLLGPVLGLLGAATRRADLLGVAAGLVLPAGAAAEMLALPLLRYGWIGDDPWLTAARVGLVALAGAASLVPVVRWLVLRRPPTGRAQAISASASA